MVDGGESVPEEECADFFKSSAKAARPLMLVAAEDAIFVKLWRVDRSLGQFLKGCDVKRVVKMAVANDDFCDIAPIFSMSEEGFLNAPHPS